MNYEITFEDNKIRIYKEQDNQILTMCADLAKFINKNKSGSNAFYRTHRDNPEFVQTVIRERLKFQCFTLFGVFNYLHHHKSPIADSFQSFFIKTLKDSFGLDYIITDDMLLKFKTKKCYLYHQKILSKDGQILGIYGGSTINIH